MARQKVACGIGEPTISVVGDRFCKPYTTELVVKRRFQNLLNDRFEVFDLTGNLLLQIDGGVWLFKGKRVMRDAAGAIILTIHEEGIDWRNKWKVYEGESDDLMFTVQDPRRLPLTYLDVFLPNKSENESCDFRALRSCISLSFDAFKDDDLLAKVIESFSLKDSGMGKESFEVIVNPEVDYAFIVVLVVIISSQLT